MPISSQIYLEIPPPEGEELNTFIELTVVSNISVQMPTEVSSFPSLDGTTVSDNAVNGNKVYQLEGIISDTINTSLASGGKQKSARDNYRLLEFVRDSHKRITLYFDNNQDPVSDCILTSLTLTKGSGMGTSYKVSLAITKILVSNASLSSIEKFIKKDVKDQLADTTKASVVPTEDVRVLTTFARLKDSGTSLPKAVVGGITDLVDPFIPTEGGQ
jgi:hypothetical protein